MDENKDFSDCWANKGTHCAIMEPPMPCKATDKCNNYETREQNDTRNQAFWEQFLDLKYPTVGGKDNV